MCVCLALFSRVPLSAVCRCSLLSFSRVLPRLIIGVPMSPGVLVIVCFGGTRADPVEEARRRERQRQLTEKMADRSRARNLQKEKEREEERAHEELERRKRQEAEDKRQAAESIRAAKERAQRAADRKRREEEYKAALAAATASAAANGQSADDSDAVRQVEETYAEVASAMRERKAHRKRKAAMKTVIMGYVVGEGGSLGVGAPTASGPSAAAASAATTTASASAQGISGDSLRSNSATFGGAHGGDDGGAKARPPVKLLAAVSGTGGGVDGASAGGVSSDAWRSHVDTRGPLVLNLNRGGVAAPAVGDVGLGGDNDSELYSGVPSSSSTAAAASATTPSHASGTPTAAVAKGPSFLARQKQAEREKEEKLARLKADEKVRWERMLSLDGGSGDGDDGGGNTGGGAGPSGGDGGNAGLLSLPLTRPLSGAGLHRKRPTATTAVSSGGSGVSSSSAAVGASAGGATGGHVRTVSPIRSQQQRDPTDLNALAPWMAQLAVEPVPPHDKRAVSPRPPLYNRTIRTSITGKVAMEVGGGAE